MISNTPFMLSRIILCCLARCSVGKSPRCSCRELKFSSYHPHLLFLQLLLLVVVVCTCSSGAWTKEAGKSRSLWGLVLIVILIHSTFTWEENLNERLCRPGWSVGVSVDDCLDYVVDVGQPELCKSEEGKHACIHCSRILYIIIL